MPQTKTTYALLPLDRPESEPRARAFAKRIYGKSRSIYAIWYWPAWLPAYNCSVDDCSRIILEIERSVAWNWVRTPRPDAMRRRAERFEDAAMFLGGPVQECYEDPSNWFNGRPHRNPKLDLLLMPPLWQSDCFRLAIELAGSEGMARQELPSIAAGAHRYNPATNQFIPTAPPGG